MLRSCSIFCFLLKYSILIVFFAITFIACQQGQKGHTFQATVNEYYQIYQARSDFQKFLSFYDDEVLLEDIINGDRIEGKQALSEFFDWDNPEFSLIEAKSLIIEEQIIDNNSVVTKGYFTPFRWGAFEFEAMHFTTLLTFNENKKIIKQIDWINYPNNLVDYTKRKNANDWLNK